MSHQGHYHYIIGELPQYLAKIPIFDFLTPVPFRLVCVSMPEDAVCGESALLNFRCCS